MLRAIIDVGSNTIRLSLYECDEVTNEVTQVLNKKVTAGLAGYIVDGELADRGVDRACRALRDLKRKAEHFEADSIDVFATAAIRNASNHDQVIDRIDEATDLRIDTLSGEDEARLGFYGAMHTLSAASGVLIDIGGGSTELVMFEDKHVVTAVSMPVGSLNLYLDHVCGLIPTADEEALIAANMNEQLDAIPGIAGREFDTIHGVGGTIRAAGKLIADRYGENSPKDEKRIPTGNLRALADTIEDDPRAGMLRILQVAPDRIHTLTPGIISALTIARRFHATTLMVSAYGVREGYLHARVIKDATRL